jgi:hypothetical protein
MAVCAFVHEVVWWWNDIFECWKSAKECTLVII